MISIRNIEIHISHACNLFCKQCTHYSNFSHRGMLTKEEANFQMGLWSNRINTSMFSMLGGEPAVNRELCDIVRLSRKHWRNKLQLVSNGFLLKNHPDLPKILSDIDCNLEISIHHSSEEYQERFKPVRELLLSWESKYNINLNIRQSVDKWTRTYIGDGLSMKPYEDKNPRKSWEVCRSKWCPQIHNGYIYKCPQIAYLPMQVEKIGSKDGWEKYLEYKPISSECSQEELKEFLSRESESCCNMCPANPELFQLQNPLRKN